MAVPLPEADRKDNVDERGEHFESDIKLPPGTKAGNVNPQRRWPNGNVVYEFDPSLSKFCCLACERAGRSHILLNLILNH